MAGRWKVPAALTRWAWQKSGFHKYGLYVHDCIEETPMVTEALRRLPEHVRDERNFRLVRAIQLSTCKTILPKEQWSRFENETWYLKEHLDEVEREISERAEWGKNMG